MAAPPIVQRGVEVGSRRFIGVLAMCTAVSALGIDTVLPAYSEIRETLDLAPDATSVTGLVSFYFLGSAVGLIPAGLLSDRFGRRPVMWGGLLIYAAAAIASAFAPTLTSMFVTRFLWGVGSAGPRVAALAMVRDVYEGDRMARMMSLIMAVFIIVPTLAPAMASGIMLVGPWQWIYWFCAIAAVFIALGVARLPETLAADRRRRLDLADVRDTVGVVLRTPGTIWYVAALTTLFGAFMSYLASSQLVIDKVFGLDRWFPLVFAAVSLTMGAGMWLNGRVVESVGLERLIGRTFTAHLVLGSMLLVIALTTAGVPPFWMFLPVLAVTLLFMQMLVPNLNAAAMRPLGRVAGTGAAVLGMLSSSFGALLGSLVDRRFDETITPLSIAFVLYGTIAALSWRRARRADVTAVRTVRVRPGG